MPHQKEIKAIKLLQDRADEIQSAHDTIGVEVKSLKESLISLDDVEAILESDEYAQRKQSIVNEQKIASVLEHTSLKAVYAEAESRYTEPLGLSDILSIKDFAEAERRVDLRIQDFNRRYGLDGWDYAIAGGCGLFAAMLDLLCVRSPLKPTISFVQEVDGIFNRWVQEAFNNLIPPDLSKALSKAAPIGSADCSTVLSLIDAPLKALNPMNHRLRSLAHDPILGFIFGVWDMLHGTCTIISNGEIISVASTKGPTDASIFQLLGRMLGHLLSDVNAPSANGNRGMGLPAPFMGLLRMFEGIPVGDSNFGRQIEWMYANGYDFRQFVATSIPMLIMEVMLRSFYIGKQMKLYNAPFGETVLDTMPTRMNPRFRMMLALAYGTSSAVNAGKMYVTQNILNANYASWMGLAWNGFHALKWALLDRHLKLWDGITEAEIAAIQDLNLKIDSLTEKAEFLPT